MSEKKTLTKFTNAETIVTAEFANSIYGGLYGTSEGSQLATSDPRVSGHVHDGKHEDGHVSKVNLVNHVDGQLRNQNIADRAITPSKIMGYTNPSNAIPVSEVISGTTYYYIDPSTISGGGGSFDSTNIRSFIGMNTDSPIMPTYTEHVPSLNHIANGQSLEEAIAILDNSIFTLSDHASSHLSGATDEIDGDKLDIDFVPTNYTRTVTSPTTTTLQELSSHLKGIDDTIGILSGLNAHASKHIFAGSDEIDADKLRISYIPNYYTRTPIFPNSANALQLTSHLKGIDDKLNQTFVFERVSGIVRNQVANSPTDDFVFGSPTLTNSGDPNFYSRFFFEKAKHAFRAGLFPGASYNIIGIGSTAFGTNALAAGTKSFAVGDNVKAHGVSTISIGVNSDAFGANSAIFGSANSSAVGQSSIILGGGNNSTTSTGTFSAVLGLNNIARHSNSLVTGTYANSKGSGSRTMSTGRWTDTDKGNQGVGSFNFSEVLCRGDLVDARTYLIRPILPTGGIDTSGFFTEVDHLYKFRLSIMVVSSLKEGEVFHGSFPYEFTGTFMRETGSITHAARIFRVPTMKYDSDFNPTQEFAITTNSGEIPSIFEFESYRISPGSTFAIELKFRINSIRRIVGKMEMINLHTGYVFSDLVLG